ncbi:SRPBCC family protein [Nakamurella lactea]|uniref:SRPBCC family protein n=1 Tax=Nakamurella lactea TaxID=459515 RepID=UPI000419EF76|nr:SRPBCC family protein [Nakamurella lactea]
MTTTDDRLGVVERDGEHWRIRFQRRLNHSPETVWRALTDSAQLQHWMPCDIVGERRAGAEIELPFWPAHVEKYGIQTPTLQGTIRVWDPPCVFEWTWETDVLRWELEPRDGTTILTFTTWLGNDDNGAANTAAGYHACLANLVGLLDTGAAPPLVDADVGPLEQVYGRAVRAAH